MSIQFLDVEEIEPNPINVRSQVVHDQELVELANSIREHGLLQPIVVYRHLTKWRIRYGHRRFAAIQLIGWPTAKCMIVPAVCREDTIEQMLIENLHRKGLNPMEEAEAFQALHNMGMSQEAISKRVGKSDAHVSMRLALLELPVEEQEKVRRGERKVTEAMEEAVYLRRTRRGGVPGKRDRGWNPPHFDREHPLNQAAENLCDQRGHNKRRRIFHACGACWEDVIRDDERRVARQERAS